MITSPSGRKLGRGPSLFFAEGGLADKAALVLNLRNVRSQPKADMTNLHMGGFGPSLWSRTNLAAGIEANIQFD